MPVGREEARSAATTAPRLSPVQRKHLDELADMRDSGATGEAYWYPFGSSEHRTADALARRGLLTRRYQPSCYTLTDKGYAAVRS